MIANASHLRSHNGRKAIAVSEAAPEAELNYFLSPLHSCRHLGNARRPFSCIADWLTGWLGDDMMPLRARGLA